MMGFKPTLYLYKNHKVLFPNIGRNLEPLIELNNFISRYVQNREGLVVHKVIGKAAAVFYEAEKVSYSIDNYEIAA